MGLGEGIQTSAFLDNSLEKTNGRISMLVLDLWDQEKAYNSPTRKNKGSRVNRSIEKVVECLRIHSWAEW
jgi:hypothetical protein